MVIYVNYGKFLDKTTFLHLAVSTG